MKDLQHGEGRWRPEQDETAQNRAIGDRYTLRG
jgi:hypothetical protein